jgi:MFS family permease
LPKLLVSDRTVLGVLVSGLLVGAAFGAFWNTWSFVLLRNFGFGPVIVGLFDLVAAASAATSPLAGHFTDRFGGRLSQFVLTGMAIIGWGVLVIGPRWVGWSVPARDGDTGYRCVG